jgi:cyclopentanol dehydrogenase
MPQPTRVAVITGAASGIGEAAAVLLSERGYQVVGLDIAKKATSSSRKSEDLSSNILWLHCDVSVEKHVRQAVQEVMARFGRLDVLVNNAGMVLTRSLTQTRWAEFDRLYSLNVGGQFLMCKYVVPAMRLVKGGAIVNIASISAHVGSVNNVLYCGSKGAVVAMTKALALELAEDGIRVNSISPGYIDTPMLRRDLEAQARLTSVSADELITREATGQLFRRFASPREVAEAIYFLSSEAASFITGSDLVVDCGWMAK